jgi:uncharacterized membrane protein
VTVRMTPEKFRDVVSTILLVGVVTAAALMALGFLGALVVGWDGSVLGKPASSSAATDFGSLWVGLSEGRPIAIAQLGLVVLLATPVARVGASVVGFALEGDRTYVAITIAVLAVLLASIALVR